ncbi:MAG: RluA family pseudouridine synthase [Deltaproteobacteria bacterium]|nr:RluA family pseudouridine synthase [Deltaproteobacteria bacterium]
MTSLECRVVHRDAQLLVVYKPSGLLTTAPKGGDCLARRVAQLDPDAPRLHASSRLDAEVTGLVTFARTPEATAALIRARESGRYQRLYLGLLLGEVPARGRWELPIGVDPVDSRRRLAGAGRAPKSAATRFVRRASAAGVSLVELRPETGRTHQLRVHAQAAGFPLLGDRVYGGARRVVLEDGRVVSVRRVMLHCAALGLPDVVRGGRLCLEAPLPEDVQRVWRGLGGDAAALSLAPGAAEPPP